MNDTICGGTGGSGWDNEDGGEGKETHLRIPIKILAPVVTVSFFADVCPHCGGTHFKAIRGHVASDQTNPRDGRWGIGAKESLASSGMRD